MKKKLSEVFIIKEKGGWIPIDLNEMEWIVVKMALDKYSPPDQNQRKVVDAIKNKLKILDSEHDIGQGRNMKFNKDIDTYKGTDFQNEPTSILKQPSATIKT